MDNKEFIELSEKRVKSLNGSDKEESFEAWRAGYIYFQNIVKKHIRHDHMEDFLDKMEAYAYSQ